MTGRVHLIADVRDQGGEACLELIGTAVDHRRAFAAQRFLRQHANLVWSQM